MAHLVFCLLALIAGFAAGFIFGCSHTGLFIGLIKGSFIGGLMALDFSLYGGATIYCWCLLGAGVTGSIVATYISPENRIKRHFDLRRPIDF